MADEKWITGLRGDVPVREAARRVLDARLTVVRHRLAQATTRDDDTEHVHQLRVSTRRAAAALRVFADFLPRRLGRRMRKCLQSLRRAAGAARDWDVFLAMLAERSARSDARTRRGFDLLLGYAHGRRRAARAALDAIPPGAGGKLARLADEAEKALGDDESGEALGDFAVRGLTRVLVEFRAATAGDLSSHEALHRVRILGKRLRYALELFEGCFDSSLREEAYPRVVEMQDTLGLANDSHVALGLLAELRTHLGEAQAAYRPAFDSLQRFHQRRLREQRRKFAAWLQQPLELPTNTDQHG